MSRPCVFGCYPFVNYVPLQLFFWVLLPAFSLPISMLFGLWCITTKNYGSSHNFGSRNRRRPRNYGGRKNFNKCRDESTYDTLSGIQVLNPSNLALWKVIFRFPGRVMLMFLSKTRGSRGGIPASSIPFTIPGMASRVAFVKHSSLSSEHGWM